MKYFLIFTKINLQLTRKISISSLIAIDFLCLFCKCFHSHWVGVCSCSDCSEACSGNKTGKPHHAFHKEKENSSKVGGVDRHAFFAIILFVIFTLMFIAVIVYEFKTGANNKKIGKFQIYSFHFLSTLKFSNE